MSLLKNTGLFSIGSLAGIQIVLIFRWFISLILKIKICVPFAELYKAKKIFGGEGFYPELCLIVHFGNLVIQIFLPLSSEFDYERSLGMSPNTKYTQHTRCTILTEAHLEMRSQRIL